MPKESVKELVDRMLGDDDVVRATLRAFNEAAKAVIGGDRTLLNSARRLRNALAVYADLAADGGGIKTAGKGYALQLAVEGACRTLLILRGADGWNYRVRNLD